jgi:tetratricopeptide (TPR) repeat protein
MGNWIHSLGPRPLKTILIVLCVQRLCCLPALCEPSVATVLDRNMELHRAMLMLIHHQDRDAIEVCNQLIRTEPSLAAALAIRGRAEVNLGETDTGMADLNKVIKMHVVDAEVYHSLAHAYIMQKDYRDAAVNYGLASKLVPSRAIFSRQQGELLTEIHEYKQALDCFARAIKAEPRLADNFVSRATTYFSMGNFQKAIDDYTTAIKLNPRDLRYYGLRATCYKKLGRNDLSEKDIKKANENAFEL